MAAPDEKGDFSCRKVALRFFGPPVTACRRDAPEKPCEDPELFLPALSAAELMGMFTGMKLKAPVVVFEFAQTLGEKMVARPIWAKVKSVVASS